MTDTYDANDPEQLARIEAQERANRRSDLDVMRLIMRTKNGRGWLARRLVEWHLLGAEFFPGQPDVTAFRLGEKNCARRLEEDAKEASFDQYVLMLKEQIDDRRQRDMLVRESKKAEEEAMTSTQQGPLDLPPPAGWPGGPPLPEIKPEGES